MRISQASKIKHLLSIAVALFVAATAQAADCEIRASKAGEVANRSVVIAFPDGREITVIGHNHGARTAAEVVLQLASRTPQEASNEDYVADLEFQLEQKPEAARDSKQDFSFLKKYLVQTPSAKFVGLEGSPQTVQNQLAYYERIRTALGKQRTLRKLSPSALDLNIQTYAYGAASYLKMVEPGQFKSKSLIGFEDQSAGDAYLKAEAAFQNEIERLKLVTTVSRAGLLSLQQWLKDVMLVYPTYEPAKHDAELLSALKSKLKASEWTAAERFARSRLAVLKAMRARDRADVANLLKQEGTGVAFVGRDHLQSFAALLKAACDSKLDHASSVGNVQKKSNSAR